MSIARSERAALAEALRLAGPDAPTLCEGWDAHDLAVHLWLRENELAALGIIGGPFASHLAQRMATLRRERRFADLVAEFAEGPPRWSLFALPGLDAAANSAEFFVHTEDVRRAQHGWELREPDDGYQSWAWGQLLRLAPLRLRNAGVSVVLESTANSQTRRIGTGGSIVTLVGQPTELLLLLYGRGESARVRYVGDADAVERLRRVRLAT